MEIKSNEDFVEALPLILSAVSDAQFVALDLEFGGVAHGSFGGSLPDLAERYGQVRAAASRFPILQLGLTTARWDSPSGSFHTRTFNITVDATSGPALGIDREFSFSSDAVRFLKGHGFQFQECFANGVRYLSRHEERTVQNSPVQLIPNEVPLPATEEEQADFDRFTAYVHCRLDLLDVPGIMSVSIFPFVPSQLEHNRDEPPPLFARFSAAQRALVRKCVEERPLRSLRTYMNQDKITVRKVTSPDGPPAASTPRPSWQAERQARILEDRNNAARAHIGLRWLIDFLVGAVNANDIRDALAPGRLALRPAQAGQRSPAAHPPDSSTKHGPTIQAVQDMLDQLLRDSSASGQVKERAQEAADSMNALVAVLRKQPIEQTDHTALPNLLAPANAWDSIPRPSTKRKVPFVGHNNFADILYLYNAFIGPLPPTIAEFSKEIHSLFPVIIDTKFVGRIGLHSLAPNMPLTDLVSVKHMQAEPKITAFPSLSSNPNSDGRAHQAGHDSWLTALYMIRTHTDPIVQNSEIELDQLRHNLDIPKSCNKSNESVYRALFDVFTDGRPKPNEYWKSYANKITVLACSDKFWDLEPFLEQLKIFLN